MQGQLNGDQCPPMGRTASITSKVNLVIDLQFVGGGSQLIEQSRKSLDSSLSMTFIGIAWQALRHSAAPQHTK